jgi:hypothetical protein
MLARTLFCSALLLAAIPAQACGMYRLRGWVREIGSDFYLVLNEHTRSETRFHVAFQKDVKLYGYRNRFVEAQVRVVEPMDGTRGEIERIALVKLSRPILPPEGADVTLVQLKKESCSQTPAPQAKPSVKPSSAH